MIIKILNSPIEDYQLRNIIHNFFETTRFKCSITSIVGSKSTNITISGVRLRESKPYCGSHPYECEVGGGRKATFLEGADWVEFNDRLNDILDLYGISANVNSAVCILRKDKRRRVHYEGHLDVNQFQWNRDEDDEHYQDYCGLQAPNSWYPVGTPGIYERMLNA